MVQVARAPSVLQGGIFGSRFGVLIATTRLTLFLALAF